MLAAIVGITTFSNAYFFVLEISYVSLPHIFSRNKKHPFLKNCDPVCPFYKNLHTDILCIADLKKHVEDLWGLWYRAEPSGTLAIVMLATVCKYKRWIYTQGGPDRILQKDEVLKLWDWFGSRELQVFSKAWDIRLMVQFLKFWRLVLSSLLWYKRLKLNSSVIGKIS